MQTPLGSAVDPLLKLITAVPAGSIETREARASVTKRSVSPSMAQLVISAAAPALSSAALRCASLK